MAEIPAKVRNQLVSQSSSSTTNLGLQSSKQEKQQQDYEAAEEMTEPSVTGKRKKQSTRSELIETTEIPSYGIEFFEYRRKLWLAGKSYPKASSSNPPSTYTVPLDPPSPLPLPAQHRESPAIHRLEKTLRNESSIGLQSTWNGGIADICKLIDNGSRLKRPLPLDLAIKVLRCKWIIDGTWATDPITKRAAIAPDSPPRPAVHLAASRPEIPVLLNGLGQAQLSPPKAWKTAPVIVNEEDEEGLSDDHLESMGLRRNVSAGPAPQR